METRMTVQEALEETVRMLEGVKVPISQMEEIGFPVARAVSNIKLCLEAMTQQQEANKAEEAKEENSEQA